MHRTHTRLLGLLLVVCLTALTAGTSANAFAVRRGGTRARARTSAPASHEKKWKAPNTAKLVRAVTHAHTVQARTKAVDNVLKGVGVGVYSGSGKRIVGGFERNAHDIYLYDFEVKLIVDQLADKTMGSFDQVAAQFAKAGMKINNKKVTGTTLAKAVASGIKRLGKKKWRSTPRVARSLPSYANSVRPGITTWRRPRRHGGAPGDRRRGPHCSVRRSRSRRRSRSG